MRRLGKGRAGWCGVMACLVLIPFMGLATLGYAQEGRIDNQVKQLIKELNIPSGQQQAIKALVEIGKPAVEPLIGMLKSENPLAVWAALEALVKIGKPSVTPLIAALGDTSPSIQLQVPVALGRIRDVEAVSPLIAALNDKQRPFRQEVAAALGEIGDLRAIKPLIAALKDEDWNVRLDAAIGLRKMGKLPVEGVDTLITILDGKGGLYIAQRAAEELGKIGDPRAIKPLEKLARHGATKELRQEARDSLIKLKVK